MVFGAGSKKEVYSRDLRELRAAADSVLDQPFVSGEKRLTHSEGENIFSFAPVRVT